MAESSSDDNAIGIRYVLPVLQTTSYFHTIGEIQI